VTTAWEAHLLDERRMRRRHWRAAHRGALRFWWGVGLGLLATLLLVAVSLAGCAAPVKRVDVSEEEWRPVRSGQVLCTADACIEVVDKCYDYQTGQYYLELRRR